MIDIHCHFVPSRTREMLAGIPTVRLGDAVVSHDGRTLPLPPRLSDAEAFAAHCASLDFALVSPPPGLYLESLAAEQPDYVSRVNTDLAESVAGRNGIGLLGWLPLGSPEQALAEIERMREQPALVGFTIGTAKAAALLDPAFDRVWQALADAGLALQLHPDSDPWQEHAKGIANPSVLGFPAATTSIVVALLVGGDGFWASGVRLCLVHGGGFLALALPRLTRAVPGSREIIAERVARLYSDALVFGDPATALVEATFAPGHVLPGSDWPFPIGLSELPGRTDWPAALASWAPRARPLVGRENTTVHRREIAPGVLVYEGEAGMPNAVALIGAERLVIVDSLFTPRHAQEMLDDLRTVTDLPVWALVNTHFHGDHTLGNGVIPTDRVIAARGVAERLGSRGEEYRQLLCGVRPDLSAEIEGVAWRLPTEEIDGPLDLDLGGLTVQLRPVAAVAHTEADLYVLLPELRIVIASDLVFNGILPVARDSDPVGWRASLRALAELDVDLVVPGHGPVGGPELIEQQLAVLDDIEAAVRAAAPGTPDAAADTPVDAEAAALAPVAGLLHADERIAPYARWFTADREDL